MASFLDLMTIYQGLGHLPKRTHDCCHLRSVLTYIMCKGACVDVSNGKIISIFFNACVTTANPLNT